MTNFYLRIAKKQIIIESFSISRLISTAVVFLWTKFQAFIISQVTLKIFTQVSCVCRSKRALERHFMMTQGTNFSEVQLSFSMPSLIEGCSRKTLVKDILDNFLKINSFHLKWLFRKRQAIQNQFTLELTFIVFEASWVFICFERQQ